MDLRDTSVEFIGYSPLPEFYSALDPDGGHGFDPEHQTSASRAKPTSGQELEGQPRQSTYGRLKMASVLPPDQQPRGQFSELRQGLLKRVHSAPVALLSDASIDVIDQTDEKGGTRMLSGSCSIGGPTHQ